MVKFDPSTAGTNYAGSDYTVIERNIDAYYGSDSITASHGTVSSTLVSQVDTRFMNNISPTGSTGRF